MHIDLVVLFRLPHRFSSDGICKSLNEKLACVDSTTPVPLLNPLHIVNPLDQDRPLFQP